MQKKCPTRWLRREYKCPERDGAVIVWGNLIPDEMCRLTVYCVLFIQTYLPRCRAQANRKSLLHIKSRWGIRLNLPRLHIGMDLLSMVPFLSSCHTSAKHYTWHLSRRLVQSSMKHLSLKPPALPLIRKQAMRGFMTRRYLFQIPSTLWRDHETQWPADSPQLETDNASYEVCQPSEDLWVEKLTLGVWMSRLGCDYFRDCRNRTPSEHLPTIIKRRQPTGCRKHNLSTTNQDNESIDGSSSNPPTSVHMGPIVSVFNQSKAWAVGQEVILPCNPEIARIAPYHHKEECYSVWSSGNQIPKTNIPHRGVITPAASMQPKWSLMTLMNSLPSAVSKLRRAVTVVACESLKPIERVKPDTEKSNVM